MFPHLLTYDARSFGHYDSSWSQTLPGVLPVATGGVLTVTSDCPQSTQLGTMLSGCSQLEQNFEMSQTGILWSLQWDSRGLVIIVRAPPSGCHLPTGVARPVKMVYDEQEERGPQWVLAGLWKPSLLDPRSISDASTSFYLTMEEQGEPPWTSSKDRKWVHIFPKEDHHTLYHPAVVKEGVSWVEIPQSPNNR